MTAANTRLTLAAQFNVGHKNMNEVKQQSSFDWGLFWMNNAPFILAVIFASNLLFHFAIGPYVLFAAPLLMLATVIPILFCLRRGLCPTQRVLTVVLNIVALGFYGYMTWGLVMLWKIGPLKH